MILNNRLLLCMQPRRIIKQAKLPFFIIYTLILQHHVKHVIDSIISFSVFTNKTTKLLSNVCTVL